MFILHLTPWAKSNVTQEKKQLCAKQQNKEIMRYCFFLLLLQLVWACRDWRWQRLSIFKSATLLGFPFSEVSGASVIMVKQTNSLWKCDERKSVSQKAPRAQDGSSIRNDTLAFTAFGQNVMPESKRPQKWTFEEKRETERETLLYDSVFLLRLQMMLTWHLASQAWIHRVDLLTPNRELELSPLSVSDQEYFDGHS